MRMALWRRNHASHCCYLAFHCSLQLLKVRQFRIGLLLLLQDDGLSRDDMGCLIDTFGSQPLDFFGALRQATCSQCGAAHVCGSWP